MSEKPRKNRVARKVKFELATTGEYAKYEVTKTGAGTRDNDSNGLEFTTDPVPAEGDMSYDLGIVPPETPTPTTTTVTDTETPTTTTVTTSPGAQFGGGVRRTFRKSSENFHRNPLHSYFQQEVTQSAGKKRFSERQTPGSRQIETDFRAVFAIRTRLLGC